MPRKVNPQGPYYRLERIVLMLAYERFGSSVIAAQKLGIGRETLSNKLREYGFKRGDGPRLTWADVEYLDNLVNELKFTVPPPPPSPQPVPAA